MTGKELAEALAREGFVVVRRSKSLTWLRRGEDALLVDENAEVADDVAQQFITRARAPRT